MARKRLLKTKVDRHMPIVSSESKIFFQPLSRYHLKMGIRCYSEVDFSISELFQLSSLMDEYRLKRHYRPSQRSGLSLVVSWRNWKWRVQ